jgi:hypothetical protein
MSRHSRRNMNGGAITDLIPPQVVAVEEGHQEMLRQSHVKVDGRYFAIDPSLSFESSTILCEDRVYVSDQVPNATQPITFTIQPQFNVFRSLSESRFVFTVQAVIPAIVTNLVLVPKPYWSQLFIRDFTANINNVAVNDQHSRTASYAGFIKIIMTQGNLKAVSLNYTANIIAGATTTSTEAWLYSWAGDDTRSLQEGIINIDAYNGEDYMLGYNNIVMALSTGAGNSFGDARLLVSNPYSFGAPVINCTLELTYRPQDGIFRQPKLLPPGVNLNYIFNLNTLGVWCNGYQKVNPNASALFYSLNPDAYGVSFNVLRAQYFERQYVCSQTCLKAYQSLIMRQPLYFSCLTGNTLLYPITQTQQSIQLTNVFSGRLPNVVVVALLNQSPKGYAVGAGNGNVYTLGTYSPTPPASEQVVYNPLTGANSVSTGDCIQSIQMTVNGRTYPHLWSSNMQPFLPQDISQWYEQYRQCSLITALNGRSDGESNSNYDTTYKYDNPILTKAEFQSQATFCCFNIRRSGTLYNCSGDKEVGGIDMLVNINGSLHPNAQLLISALNTDSLMTITDGGSTTSFVF